MRWFINPFGSQGSCAFENLLFSHDPMPAQVHRGSLQSSCAVFLHKHAPTMSIDEQKYDALELSHHGNNSILLKNFTPPQRHAISSTPTSRSRLSEPPFARPQTDLPPGQVWSSMLNHYHWLDWFCDGLCLYWKMCTCSQRALHRWNLWPPLPWDGPFTSDPACSAKAYTWKSQTRLSLQRSHGKSRSACVFCWWLWLLTPRR